MRYYQKRVSEKLLSAFSHAILGKLGAKEMRKIIAVVTLAMLVIGAIAFVPTFANADTQFDSLWAKLRGVITKWGDASYFGWLKADVHVVNINGTIREWARVDAIWSNETRRLNVTEDPVGTFTFSFYTARLVNTSIISFNSSGFDFYVSGLWNVWRVTTTLTIDENDTLVSFTRAVEPVVSQAQGELRVPAHTGRFELSITGIDMLSGFLWAVQIQFKEIKLFDLTGDGKVTIHDLVRVARRYGSVTGMRAYDFEMDFNLEGKVTIGDIATVATNIEG